MRLTNIAEKLSINSATGCWEWSGCVTKKGYGLMTRKNKNHYIHRYVWEVVNGPIPEGLCICHHCDNRKCGNPEHLFLGTSKDNTQDMMKKGRNSYKVMNRLSEVKINRMLDLRTIGYTYQQIGDVYNCSLQNIHSILKRRGHE